MTFNKSISGKYEVRAAYKIEPLDKEEYETLQWLAGRGYDADIFKETSGEETEDGGYKFDDIPEHVAWKIQEAYNEDPNAFLASNGSETLSDKLWAFLQKIV